MSTVAPTTYLALAAEAQNLLFREARTANTFTDDDYRAESARFNALIQVGYCILGIRAAGLAAGPSKPGPNAWFPRSPRLAYDEVVTTA
ncbi:hypothetical protein ACFQZZ_32995 [Nocardia sp. GCM10030253]|uniref:hypothetical protein n=1 Tax=Nocardia sp. GCM10030253 TaxID=3273404 RepID=UPI0036358CAE